MARSFNQKFEQQPAPAFFVRGPTAFARLVFFSALSLALMATDSRLQYLTNLRESLEAALHPLQLLANTPVQIYRDMDEYFSTHDHLLSENQQLKQQALKQSVALQRLNSLALENEHLRQLLNANKAMAEHSILGEIMHIGRDPFTKKVIVNRGETDGIVAGEAVVDATGVIGQVTRIYPLSSEVTLITDKSLAIPVQVERNGLRAIAFGHGRDNTLDLPYLPTSVDIRSGDILVTSGIDGVYPAGLAVAKVTHIEINPDSPFARIVCVPTGGVESHGQILLVGTPRAETLPSNMVSSTPKADLAPTSAKALPTKPAQKNTDKATVSTTGKPPQRTAEKIIEKIPANNTSNAHAPE